MALKSMTLSNNFVIRIKPDLKIYYVNDDFLEFTGFSADEVLLKDLTEVVSAEMNDLFKEILIQNLKSDNSTYFIQESKTKQGDTFWSLMRVTPFKSKMNNEDRFLVEIKMLPVNAIEETEKVFNTVKKIYNNAGKDYAKKYFEGFLEERNQTFEEFVIDLLGVKKKRVDKYFNMF
jgi:PAS domain S-box-containing protein